MLAAVLVALRLSEAGGCASRKPETLPEKSRASQPSPTEAGLRPVRAWERLFREQWSKDERDASAWSTSRDSWNHYRLSFSVDALNAMYLATGNAEYLGEALRLTENVARTAEPSTSLPLSDYGDHYLGWASKRVDTRGQEVPLFESYFWRYATTTLRIMRDTGASEQPAFRARYARLLVFAERNVFGKWYVRGARENIYRSNTHMAAHWALIAMNLAETTQDRARRQRYRHVVERINTDMPNYDSSLRGQMRAHPADGRAFFWDDTFESSCPPGSDVSHGNGVIAYAVDAQSARYGWTEGDMRRFVLTLTEAVWPRGRAPAEYVDGSGTGSGWFSDGFVKLGRFDAGLQRRLEAHEPANVQFYANGALNAALLFDRPVPGLTVPSADVSAAQHRGNRRGGGPDA